jgi:hypothetical protein
MRSKFLQYQMSQIYLCFLLQKKLKSNFVESIIHMNSFFKHLPEQVLTKKIKRGDFPFSQYLFWDTAVENIDPILNRTYIIERVLSRGTLEDFYYLLQLYTTDEIRSAIKSSRVLDKRTVNFCSHYFKIPLNELHASSYYP